ncbi:hypothetical protein J3E69DRAFT_338586 [Trichoderma sp. SZMC 28015]
MHKGLKTHGEARSCSLILFLAAFFTSRVNARLSTVNYDYNGALKYEATRYSMVASTSASASATSTSTVDNSLKRPLTAACKTKLRLNRRASINLPSLCACVAKAHHRI